MTHCRDVLSRIRHRSTCETTRLERPSLSNLTTPTYLYLLYHPVFLSLILIVVIPQVCLSLHWEGRSLSSATYHPKLSALPCFSLSCTLRSFGDFRVWSGLVPPEWPWDSILLSLSLVLSIHISTWRSCSRFSSSCKHARSVFAVTRELNWWLLPLSTSVRARNTFEQIRIVSS